MASIKVPIKKAVRMDCSRIKTKILSYFQTTGLQSVVKKLIISKKSSSGELQKPLFYHYVLLKNLYAMYYKFVTK